MVTSLWPRLSAHPVYTVIPGYWGNYEQESRGDLGLHNHKMNGTQKLLTYMQTKITDCLALEVCMIWTSQKQLHYNKKFVKITKHTL